MAGWAEATALLVIDLQRGYDSEEHYGLRNNPGCEMNVGMLLEAWRSQGWPVVTVQYDDPDEYSLLRPGTSGNALKPVAAGEADLSVRKSVQSAFFGRPDLHAWLQENGIKSVAVCGVRTNTSCEITARMAADLGYEVLFVMDATYTFDLKGPDGVVLRGRELAKTTGMNLEFAGCRVMYTSELVG
jgi:nicotinamidase-related amidase